jgi:hypothetical protein
MKSTVRTLHFLMVCASPQLWAGPEVSHSAEAAKVNAAQHDAIRGSVERHRAAQREERQREEAAAGRRLTSAELAQLRNQVRQQSMLLSGDQAGVVEVYEASGRRGGDPARVLESQSGPAPLPSHTMPRSQRQQ